MIIVAVSFAIIATIVLLSLMKIKCPKCGGEVYFEYEDTVNNITVYKCKNCGEEWI